MTLPFVILVCFWKIFSIFKLDNIVIWFDNSDGFGIVYHFLFFSRPKSGSIDNSDCIWLFAWLFDSNESIWFDFINGFSLNLKRETFLNLSEQNSHDFWGCFHENLFDFVEPFVSNRWKFIEKVCPIFVLLLRFFFFVFSPASFCIVKFFDFIKVFVLWKNQSSCINFLYFCRLSCISFIPLVNKRTSRKSEYVKYQYQKLKKVLVILRKLSQLYWQQFVHWDFKIIGHVCGFCENQTNKTWSYDLAQENFVKIFRKLFELCQILFCLCFVLLDLRCFFKFSNDPWKLCVYFFWVKLIYFLDQFFSENLRYKFALVDDWSW